MSDRVAGRDKVHATSQDAASPHPSFNSFLLSTLSGVHINKGLYYTTIKFTAKLCEADLLTSVGLERTRALPSTIPTFTPACLHKTRTERIQIAGVKVLVLSSCSCSLAPIHSLSKCSRTLLSAKVIDTTATKCYASSDTNSLPVISLRPWNDFFTFCWIASFERLMCPLQSFASQSSICCTPNTCSISSRFSLGSV